MIYHFICQGMIGSYLTHNHCADLISSIWGSYFYYPDPKKVKNRSKDSLQLFLLTCSVYVNLKMVLIHYTYIGI